MEVSSTNLMASLGSMVFLGDDRLGKETRRLGSLSLVCSMIQPCIFYRYQYNRVYICIMRVDVARKTTASSSQGSVMVPCLYLATRLDNDCQAGYHNKGQSWFRRTYLLQPFFSSSRSFVLWFPRSGEG